ncbi:unnamed protein product [Parajaminaea phylloscopi]
MPPAVTDTHCSGPGLLPTTSRWGAFRRKYWQYLGEKDPAKVLPLPPKQDLRGKTVIISGANSGIGKEAAYQFAAWGANVVLACRDAPSHEQHAEETIKEILSRDSSIRSEQLEWWEVDFAKLDSIRDFGRKWRQSGRVCDILCNNAGLSVAKRVITSDGFELTNQVNFLGHCLMTLYVLPSMQKSSAPRIVNTTSVFHYGGVLDFSNFNNEKRTSGGLHGVGWYCDTKLRLQIWTVELQRRLSRSDDYRHVIVHGCHPGFIRSNIWQNPTIQSLPWPLPQLLNFVIRKLSISTAQGALTILHSALRPDLGLPAHVLATVKGKSGPPTVAQGETIRYGGLWVNRITPHWTRPECQDALVRARLWQRVLEDLKADDPSADADALTYGLPKHPAGILHVEKS